MSRVGSNKRTNKDFERIGFLIEEVRDTATRSITTEGTTKNTLSAPEPHIPFKLAERADTDGIYITVRVNIPDKTEELRILLIRKEENSIRSGETADDAKARARRQSKKTTFRVPVSEDEQAAGFVEAEIGPLKPRKSSTDNAYQLLRLIALDDAGAFAKNPEANPFTGDVFPFPALTVRNDGGSAEENAYFTVGEGVLEIPSTPKAADFVETSGDDDTEEADAYAVFKVYASEAAPTKTFREIGVDHAFVVLRRKTAATASTGDDSDANVGIKLPKYGGPVEDLDQPFTLITVRGLKLGRRYLWVRNITTGGAAEPNKSALAEVEFIAGWGVLAGSVLDISRCTGWSLTLTPINKRHSKVTLTFQQPDPNAAAPANRPVLLKNARLYQKITSPGDGIVSDWENIRLAVLRGEDGYSSNTITVPPATDGRTKIVQWKVHHPARAQDQYYAAVRAVGNAVMYVGSNFNQVGPPGTAGGITPLSRSGTTGDDPPPEAPSEPNTNDVVENSPDTGSAENDAIVVLRVYADATKTKTFGQTNAKEVYAIVRRDTAAAGKRYKVGGPLTADELLATNVQIELPRLKLGKRYRWIKNMAVSSGNAIQENAGTNEVLIYAGNRAEDTTVTGFAITSITPVDSRHSNVSVTFTQTNPPTVLKRLVLFGKKSTDTNYVKLDSEELGDNTTVQGPGTHVLVLLAKHPKNTVMQYFARMVRGDATSFDTAVVTATSQDETTGNPPLGISHPVSSDIAVNTIETDEDIAKAKVELRVYAHDSNRTGGTITFASQNTEEVYVALRENGSSNDRIKVGGPLTSTEKTSTSVVIGVPDLVLGKQYRWNHNIAVNAHGATQSGTSAANVLVVPGNLSYTPSASQITFSAFTAIDATSTAVPITISQPSTPVRLRTLKVEKQFDNNGIWREEIRISLIDDPDLLVPSSSKTFQVVVNHPKRIGATGALKVRATIVAVKGASAFKDSTITGTGNDVGVPSWTVTPVPTLKYRSIGVIRSKCALPDININTLRGAKFCVQFYESKRLSTFGDTSSGIVNAPRYIYWDPLDDNPTTGTRYWHTTLITFNPETGFTGGLPISGIVNRAALELDKPTFTGTQWTLNTGEVHWTIMRELNHVYNNSSPAPTVQMTLLWAFTNEIGTSTWISSSAINWPW